MRLVALFCFVTACADPTDHDFQSEDAPLSRNESPLYGSYANFIKNSESTAMFDDDAQATVDLWAETNQRLIIYPAYDGDPEGDNMDTNLDGVIDMFDVSSGDADGDGITVGQYYPTLLQILAASRETSLRVIALLPERHQRSTIRHLDDVAYEAADDAEQRALWLDALKKNAEELSSLAEVYPQLIGFTVDDMGLYFCGPEDFDAAGLRISDTCYSAEELESLRQAAKTHASIGFFPTTYLHYGWMTHILPDSYTLGGLYGYNQYAGGFARARILYAPRASEKIESARLSLRLVDYNDRGAEDWTNMEASKRILVNDGILWSEPFAEEQYVRFLDEEIAPRLRVGTTNEIRIETYFDTNVTSIHNTLMTVSQPKLVVNDVEIACEVHSVEFDAVGPDAVAAGTCALYLERSGSSPDTLIAEANENYRVDQSIDGFLAVYSPRSSDYEADSYREVFAQTMSTVGADLDVFSVNYANLWTDTFSSADIDPATLAAQIEDASSAGVAGVLTWFAPVGLELPDGGIFTERTPASGYQHRAYWPYYQGGYEGWHQEWTSTSAMTGDFTICLRDNTVSSFDETKTSPRYFAKRVSVLPLSSSERTIVYEDGVGVDECGDASESAYDSAGSVCPGGDESTCRASCHVNEADPCQDGDEVITFTLAERSRISLEMQITENVGSMNVTLDAAIFRNGVIVPRSRWTFQSNLTEPKLEDTWLAVREAYAR